MDNHSDKFALAALYEATDGPNWGRNDNWCTDAPLGEWHGVTVDRSGRISKLDLTDNQLRGGIPAELAQLANLRILNLASNELVGPIPLELAQLVNLETLELCGNKLAGPIPVELAQLTNLQSLDLCDNQLRGQIPSELARLANLKGWNSTKII